MRLIYPSGNDYSTTKVGLLAGFLAVIIVLALIMVASGLWGGA